MQFSDLNYVESAAANVEGGWGRPTFGRNYVENDQINIEFNTKNNFNSHFYSNFTNSASAGAKGDVYTNPHTFSATFSKADSGAVVYEGGDSFSFSTSAAAVSTVGWY